MANRFVDQNQPVNQPFSNMQDMVNQFSACSSNPIQFLADRDINVPQQYANSPQQIAQYLLMNTPAGQQRNGIFQLAGMIKRMLGFR